MSSTGFAYPNLFGKEVPPPAPRWAGNAKYNFIGGHNDRSLIPVEGLIEATADVLRREGPISRCTAWRRGRRAISGCASSSPTSWRAGAASRPAPTTC